MRDSDILVRERDRAGRVLYSGGITLRYVRDCLISSLRWLLCLEIFHLIIRLRSIDFERNGRDGDSENDQRS